jgi:hypothetical protein
MSHEVYVGLSPVTDRIVGSNGIRWNRGVNASNLLIPEGGQLDFVLDNSDLEFNDSVNELIAGTFTAVLHEEAIQFLGFLVEPQHSGVHWIETVNSGAAGTLSLVTRHRSLSSAVYQNIRIDEAIEVVLLTCGVDPSLMDLDVGSETMRWWCLDGDPMQELIRLWYTEGPWGMLFENKSGVICFRNRDWLTTDTRSVNLQGVYGYA